jgi:glucosamine-6-phosphate deaminase
MVVVSDPENGAALVAATIGSLVTRSPTAVLGLATGSSPEPLYRNLASSVATGRLELRGVEAFLLDEYVGLAPGHPASYQEVIRHQVTEPLALDPARVHGLDGRAGDLVAECRRYETAIAAAGGVDLQLLGIGTDGHIGFNEPGSSLGSRTRLKTLTDQTVAANRRFFADHASEVPHHVLTQGIATILEARHLVLMAWGSSKAPAVALAVEGPLTAMVPASALQLHAHATVVVDRGAASRLRSVDHYRSVFARKPAWQGL